MIAQRLEREGRLLELDAAPLLVAGPPGTRARLATAMEALFPGSSRADRRFPVEVTELATDGTPARLGAATVRGWEVEHACGAPPLALRVGLAIDAATGSDYQTLRAHLGEIHAQRVVLTHMSAAMLSRLADAELPAAYDGMTIDL